MHSYESPILLGDDTTVTATPAVPVLDGLDLSNVQESKSGPGYDWKPSGDEQSYTLTLSGVVIQSHEYYGLNLPDADVTIELKEGTQNYIRGGDVVSGSSYGILASSSNLTIAGSGSLTVIGGTASQSSYGIYGIGIVEISDNAQVTAISGTAIEYSHGIHTDSNMNISDAQVTAIGGTASRGSGIFAVGNISLKGGLLITSSESDNGQALSIHNFEDLTGLDLLDPEGNKSYESKFAVYGDGSTYGVLTQTLNLLQLQSCGDLRKKIIMNGILILQH